MKQENVVVIAIVACVFLIATPAHAYVDPGIAGMLYQIGYALIVGVIAWFAGFKTLASRVFSRKKH